MSEENERSVPKPVTPLKPGNVGRNDPCHCGSGKKYKKCHLQRDEEAEHKRHLAAAVTAAAPGEGAKSTKPAFTKPVRNDHSVHAPVKSRAFNRSLFKRKTGDA